MASGTRGAVQGYRSPVEYGIPPGAVVTPGTNAAIYQEEARAAFAADEQLRIDIMAAFPRMHGGARGYKQRGGNLNDIKNAIIAGASQIVAASRSGAVVLGSLAGRGASAIAGSFRGTQTAAAIKERIVTAIDTAANTRGAMNARAAEFIHRANFQTVLSAVAGLTLIASMYGMGPPYDSMLLKLCNVILSVVPKPETILSALTTGGFSSQTMAAVGEVALRGGAATVTYYALRLAGNILRGSAGVAGSVGRAVIDRSSKEYIHAKAYVDDRVNQLTAALVDRIRGEEAAAKIAEEIVDKAGAVGAAVAAGKALPELPNPEAGQPGFIGPLTKEQMAAVEAALAAPVNKEAPELAAAVIQGAAPDAAPGAGGGGAGAGDGDGETRQAGGSRRRHSTRRHHRRSRRSTHRRSAHRKGSRKSHRSRRHH